jgi:hypothetical protein
MKRALVLALSLIILVGMSLASFAKDPYDVQVKKLYAAPEETSSLIFSIPIEVKLLDVSADANWYKVKISFQLGPFGYTYVGWANIPVGEILASRSEKVAINSPLLKND